MKALSLYEPYASAIARGLKRYETRGWPWPESLYFPCSLLICSTARTPTEALNATSDALLFLGEAVCLWDPPMLGGRALCVVDVVGCQPIETVRDELRALAGEDSPADVRRAALLELALGDYGEGRFAFELENLRPLVRQVEVKGHQKLWTPSPELVAQVEEALRA